LPPVLLPLAERLGRAMLRRRGFTSDHVPTPQGPVHTYTAGGAGDLPTTVLLHGLGAAATPFGPVLMALQRYVRHVVAPDYPGHGFSARGEAPLTPRRLFESVTTALHATAHEPAIVVGNSLGGALALRYALAYPDRVHALVLVSPAGAPCSDAEWDTIRRTFALASRAEAIAFLARLYHRPPWFAPIVAHEFPGSLARPAVRELLQHVSNADVPEPSELASLRMPILFVWGRSERLFPSAHLEYFVRHLPPHAVIEQPEGFGHCPHFDAPLALVRRIVTFARAHVGGA
jgi:pimeloyl-ACP methyl ester carboxylesterase